jgi:Uma2 family endonuclease
MAERAERRMSVEEFLDWSDGTDTRHMLVHGVPVAMAPPSQAHSRIAGNAAFEIRRRIALPCAVLSEAGIALAADTCVLADLVMTCERAGPERLVSAPRLIVEILSPSTAKDDLGLKVPGYQELASVEEIWAIDSERRAVRVWRRIEEGWLQSLPIRAGGFKSALLDAEIALDELYATTGL